MEVSLSQIDNVADLARLELSLDEREALRVHLGRILDAVALVNELQVRGDDPLVASPDAFFREDVAETSLPVDEALAAAPARSRHGFLVPKVLD